MAVALLAEGVDRNGHTLGVIHHNRQSPSSRRAWIEISGRNVAGASVLVALLAEGVDRNWLLIRSLRQMLVALLAEGVDRNLSME